MHYTERAMSNSLWVNLFTYDQISFIKWSVIIMYSVAMITLYLILMISFPGYFDSEKTMQSYYYYKNWLDNTYYKIVPITDYIWLSINLLSTLITIFVVIKIIKITETLRLTNSNVKVNKKTLIAHVFVLSLQLIAAIGLSILDFNLLDNYIKAV